MRVVLTCLLLVVAVTVFSLTGGGSLHAQAPEVNVGHFNKLAVNGYDVMTYWRGGKPLEGNRDISLDYKGATWVFISEENRAAFAADPETYAPRYGGYCAYAASLGQVSDIDVFAWRIYKGALYLNYGPRVRRQWANDIDGNIAKADALWPELLSSKKP